MRSSWVRAAKRPVRRIVILFILALIIEYLVIPELVGASKNLYLLGRVSVPWMIGGLVLESALKKAGWPADAGKVRAALENVSVDTKGLRGGPLEWSKGNHFRARQYYRVYRWDEAKSAIVQAKDWTAYEVQ